MCALWFKINTSAVAVLNTGCISVLSRQRQTYLFANTDVLNGALIVSFATALFISCAFGLQLTLSMEMLLQRCFSEQTFWNRAARCQNCLSSYLHWHSLVLLFSNNHDIFGCSQFWQIPLKNNTFVRNISANSSIGPVNILFTIFPYTATRSCGLFISQNKHFLS